MAADAAAAAASGAAAALAALDAAQSGFDRAQSAAAAGAVQPWSQELVKFLAIGLLGFSLAALLLASALMWRARAPAQQVLRVFGIVTILGLSSLLLVVGYTNEQLTPIVGLFGAIAGYLLGKDSPPRNGD